MALAGWLGSVVLMTSLAVMTSSDHNSMMEEEAEANELRVGVIVPYDERRLFSRHKLLPAVRDALWPHSNVTGTLVPGHQYNMVPGHWDTLVLGHWGNLVSGHWDNLVPGHRFVVFEADSGCSSAVASMAAIELHYQQKVVTL